MEESNGNEPRRGNLPPEHARAQAIAADALAARVAGDHVLERSLYAQAAQLETAALSAIPSDKRRTIGIIGVSVASLWYHAREFAHAQQAASDLLETELLPSARLALEELLASINAEQSQATQASSSGDERTSGAIRRRQKPVSPVSRELPVAARARTYLTQSLPLGPSDAAQIHDVEVAARLFDPHNRSFATLLRRDLTVLVGRRGSGKTSLLNSYIYRPFIDRYANPQVHSTASDYRSYDLVIAIETYKHFDDMQRMVVGDPAVFRPVEAIVDDWETVVTDYFFARLVEAEQATAEVSPAIGGIVRYLRQDESDYAKHVREMVWGVSLIDKLRHWWAPSQPPIRWTRQEALAAALEHLRSTNRRVLILFDSMDEYDIGSSVFNRTLAALVRFISQFNARQERVAIKLVLPSEVLPEITRASANPLKDLAHIDRLIWSPGELAQLAAHRFRLFLNLYDEDFADELANFDLSYRGDLRAFWRRFFPESLRNRYGAYEDSLTYILRHTQLLPRQFLMILRNVIIQSHVLTGSYRRFDATAIVDAVEAVEPLIASEILSAFGHVYPSAEALCRPIFANFPTAFSFDELEDRWRKRGRPVAKKWAPDFDTSEFSEMLLRMGIVGLSADETERYLEGRFAYDSLRPVNIGEGHALCLHPIFGRHFNAAGNKRHKAIVPEGVGGVGA